MLCPKCNTQNRDNAKFCKVCGYSFTPEDVAASSPASVHASDTQSTPGTREDVSTAAASSTNGAGFQEAQAIEVVAQPQTTAPVQSVQGTALPEDDISLAPTQILSPQEMVAFQARRWQQETVHDIGSDASHHAGSNVSQPVETDVSQPGPNQQASTQQQPSGEQTVYSGVSKKADVADMPTVMMSQNGDVTEREPMQIPPPPPPESQVAASGSDPNVSSYAQQAATPPASVTPAPSVTAPTQKVVASQDASLAQNVGGEQTGVQNQTEPQAHDESIPTSSTTPGAGSEGRDESVPTSSSMSSSDSAPSSVLAVGPVVAGRYEVVQVVSQDEQEHVYQVIDHQGYQRCWNCGSEQNAEGDEFCIDCGAELLNANYLMHEYSATASNNNDAHVLQGTIANTFVEQGKTYVIEQQHAAQLAFPNGVHLLAAGDSDAGNVRRSEPNEDSTLVLQLQRVHESLAAPVGVFIIADGMGGHDNGQGASRMTINIISDKLVRELLLPPLEAEKSGGLTASVTPMEEDRLVGVLKGAVEESNNVLVQTNQHDKTDMGSTITGFMIVGDSAFIINVGDSRTYMLREGTLYQLTNDHSLVAQLLAGGLIEPDDVYTHPQRSQIFRSLGDKMNVQVDDFKQQLLPGDILVSCSDGLWEMVRNPQITDILTNAHDPQTACTQLIEAANANGGEDNVSAVVVFVR